MHAGSTRASGRRRAPNSTHAQLVDGGEIIGGAARHDDEWLIILNGRVVTRTDRAAMVMATLQHVARRRQAAGSGVVLSVSKTVRDAANATNPIRPP